MGEGSNKVNTIYDVTPTEREIIEWRDKRRLELRTQYQKEIYNPFRNHDGHFVSTAIIGPNLEELLAPMSIRQFSEISSNFSVRLQIGLEYLYVTI